MEKVSKQSSKFLKFNDTLIYFIDVEGKKFIAYKPICDALQIDANRSYKNLKKDSIIAPALAKLPMQVENNGIIQSRNMTCIPEKYIYGWIYGLNSENEELQHFKKECYDTLFDHFNGEIGKRKELLIDAEDNQKKIKLIKEKLLDNSDYKELLELEGKTKKFSNEMKKIDKIVIGQTEMDFN
jgi:hypothetical protein